MNCNVASASSSSSGWFYGSKFSNVEIGENVTSIGNYAFYGCTQTPCYISHALTPPVVGVNVFDNSTPKKIIVKPEDIEKYKTGWSSLSNCSFLPIADVMFFENQTAESYYLISSR